jgi:carboxyl-terminal processing protease
LIKLRQELEGKGTYRGPIVILVNGESASASEFFSGALQAAKRATVIGETTCGCLLAYLGYANVPGGGRLAYSEVGFELPDGRRIEREGVVPDVTVPLAVADLQAGRDRALEAAQRVLATARPGAPRAAALAR